MRLYIRPFGAKEFACAINSQLFDFINYLTATIIALSRKTLRILVGQDRSHRFHYLGRGKIFGGYQFNPVLLAILFLLDKVKDYFILFHERFLKESQKW